jgi:hypothetical protein
VAIPLRENVLNFFFCACAHFVLEQGWEPGLDPEFLKSQNGLQVIEIAYT